MPDVTFTLYDLAHKHVDTLRASTKKPPNYSEENDVKCAKQFQSGPTYFPTEFQKQTAVELKHEALSFKHCTSHHSKFNKQQWLQNKLTFGMYTNISSEYCFIHNLKEIDYGKLQVNMSNLYSLLSTIQQTDLQLESIFSNHNLSHIEDEPTDGCSASKSSSGCEKGDSCYNSKKDKHSEFSSSSSYQDQSKRDLKFYLQNKSQKNNEELELKQSKKYLQTSNSFLLNRQLHMDKNFEQSNLNPKPLQNDNSWGIVTDSSKHCNMLQPHAKLILNAPAHKENFDMNNHKIRTEDSIKPRVQRNSDQENYLMKYDEAARLEIFKLRQRIKKYTEGPNKFRNNSTNHVQNVHCSSANILKPRKDSKLTHDNTNKALHSKEAGSESIKLKSVFQKNLAQVSHSTAMWRNNRNPTVFENILETEETGTVGHKSVIQKYLTQSSNSTLMRKKKRNPKIFEKILETEDTETVKHKSFVQNNVTQSSHSTLIQKKKRNPKVSEKNTETVNCMTSTDISSISSNQDSVHSYNNPNTFKCRNMPGTVSLCGKNENSHRTTEVLKPKAQNICTKSQLTVTERKPQKMRNDAKKPLCTIRQNNSLETQSFRLKQSHRPIPGERPLYNYDQLSYQASEVFPDLLCELEQRLVSARRKQSAIKM